eukprot:13698-Heterococcus_DN1.PRE.1
MALRCKGALAAAKAAVPNSISATCYNSSISVAVLSLSSNSSTGGALPARNRQEWEKLQQ